MIARSMSVELDSILSHHDLRQVKYSACLRTRGGLDKAFGRGETLYPAVVGHKH